MKKKSWKKALITVAIIVAVVILAIVVVQSSRNRAIGLEEQIATAKSNIDVMQKRRADLIPNLIECVKAYDKHEYETLLAIIQARDTFSDHTTQELKTMIAAVAEAYPQLQSSENYRELMAELITTENQLANYRSNYNSQVRAYNRIIRQFPHNIFLNICGYYPVKYDYLDFESSPDAPTVQF
jgi:LemA protein